jgi:hypothetical protein
MFSKVVSHKVTTGVWVSYMLVLAWPITGGKPTKSFRRRRTPEDFARSSRLLLSSSQTPAAASPLPCAPSPGFVCSPCLGESRFPPRLLPVLLAWADHAAHSARLRSILFICSVEEALAPPRCISIDRVGGLNRSSCIRPSLHYVVAWSAVHVFAELLLLISGQFICHLLSMQ